MFCYQCQETAKNTGCTVRGVCGKNERTADLQDLLITVCKGISVFGAELAKAGTVDRAAARFVMKALFTTITNAAFDDEAIIERIREGLAVRDAIRGKAGAKPAGALPECASWRADDAEAIVTKAQSAEVRITAEGDEDVRSLRELLVIGCKGIAAYAEHALVLGHEQDDVERFFFDALASTTREIPREDMVAMVLKAGETAVKTMALLDRANTSTYGNPEMTSVNLGVGKRPGILISGHDLKDMEELLAQTEGTGIDVYTHGEMLPANSYPAFKRHRHLAGNYGGSWWRQNAEFESFNGPILMTTNCLVPLKTDNTYLDRLFTTGVASYPGARHVADRPVGGKKDFAPIVARAARCKPPQPIETGTLVAGFAHHQVLALADKVVAAVKSGAIRRFVVMGGCDGRQKTRSYFTEVAEKLPKDTVILTAGCAKYRYNKLALGDIGGIPRVLDAGQCNDSYSLVAIALKLKEVLGLGDINELPLSFDIAWYEQKAVAVLLALLSLGVKGIRLGPTLPAFLSPGVAKVLVDSFGIRPTGTVDADVAAMVSGT
jgi:hydroxylamine reductase